MAEDSMPLLELLRKSGVESDVDFLRSAVEVLANKLMEVEVTAQIGASRHERSDGRAVYRNGYRTRDWDTRVGTIELGIPKLRQGSYYPSFLEPRKRGERALVAVVQEAYVHGVSTRKVDDLVRALGLDGLDKSQVSRLCSELDDMVEDWRNRALECSYVYMWLDATYLKVRENGRVKNMAVVVAVAVSELGDREVLGLDVGPAEDEEFWLQFLRSLIARGLRGLQLVISDAHTGLKKAIAATTHGAGWQRCRVHFMRNVLSQVNKSAQNVVSAAVRNIFAQSDRDSASAQLKIVADGLRKNFPRVSEMLYEAEDDVLGYMLFPEEHWSKLHSTNTLERLNKEIKRRSNVVGIFPSRKSVIRLVGALLMEQSEEWATQHRYLSQESMKKALPGSKNVRKESSQLSSADAACALETVGS